MKIDDLALLKRILEGAIMAAETPLSKKAIKELFDDLECPSDELITQALEQLAEACEERGYELKQVASGYRFQVKQDLSRWIGKLWKEKTPRYSRALLETLSLIAYRQPITRGEIESIRGVAVSSQIIRTLLERDWIKAVGHRDVPGKPSIYATTKTFLDYFNLKSLDQLPPLAEIRDLNAISRDFNIELPLELKEELAQEGGEVSEMPASNDAGDDDQQVSENLIQDTDASAGGDDALADASNEDRTSDEALANATQDVEAQVIKTESSQSGSLTIDEQQISDLEQINRDTENREADEAVSKDENNVFDQWVANGLVDAK